MPWELQRKATIKLQNAILNALIQLHSYHFDVSMILCDFSCLFFQFSLFLNLVYIFVSSRDSHDSAHDAEKTLIILSDTE